MPAWIGWGAGLLAWNAGLINAVGLLSFSHEAISHISGVTTQTGLALSRGDLPGAAHLSAVIASFLAGAVASGTIIGDSTLRLGRRYGIALGVESALLFLAMLSLRHDGRYGQYLASAACGLQNALATTYSGSVVRTTHVTGIVTDLGISIGRRLRGEAVPANQQTLLAIIFGGYLLGGVTGSLIYLKAGSETLAIPAGFTGLLALSYSGFVKFRIPFLGRRG
jgi:uncharacterized membrane protein YoaK (UPF0700 family)